jgi:hypothetical protein
LLFDELIITAIKKPVKREIGKAKNIDNPIPFKM